MAETTPLLSGPLSASSYPSFTHAIQSEKGRRPQAIAHRGYKAAFPENTMGAFRGAVEVGAHAIETDIHITKDEVVVLSHDATLKRCFGRDEKIIDVDWDYIKNLRTIRQPQQQMPRLKDLLEYLTTPGLEEIWILLDIKLDNSKEDVFRLIKKTLAEIPPSPSKLWHERVLLGCWAADQLSPCIKYLPDYPITHIGYSTLYARQFLKVPGVSFNMYQRTMTGPIGRCLLRDIKKAGRLIFVWTVNDEETMKWSIRKEVDGLITDDPKKFLEVVKKYQGEPPILKWKALGMIIIFQTLSVPFSILMRLKYGFFVDGKKTTQLLGDSRAR